MEMRHVMHHDDVSEELSGLDSAKVAHFRPRMGSPDIDARFDTVTVVLREEEARPGR